MTRKDSEKDAERPHYYSQFWLDIAAGRRVIGGPKPEDAEINESEAPEPASAAIRKTGRSNSGVYDGYKEPHGNVVAEPVVEEEEESEEEEEEADEALDEAIDEIEMPNIAVEEDEDLAAVQDEEPLEEEAADGESENEDFYDEEDETEGAEDWDRRGGRKKAKPVRSSKPIKKPKRDTRRTF